MDSSQDYYTMLGVSRDATPATIRAAFKKLALQYHPDVYKGADAHERMRLLLLAYKTLNDPAARQDYDLRLDSPAGSLERVRHASGPYTSSPRRTATKGEVSPQARRDRQRHYAFPRFRQGQSAAIDLVVFLYVLSPFDAQELEEEGMLRGVAPETRTQDYFCHRCHHRWHVAPARGKAERWDVPRTCPKCKAWDWPEYLLLYCHHCGAVFESEQIRYEIGHYSYGKGSASDLTPLCPPYELFPLCPYCGASHWCPAEEERVHRLRQRATQRALLIRFALIGLVLVMAVIVGAVLLVH